MAADLQRRVTERNLVRKRKTSELKAKTGSFLKRWQGKWLFHRGLALMQKGQWQKAANLLEKALRVNDTPFVRMHLAWTHWNLGHPVTARMHAVGATEMMPHNLATWVFAGRLMALRGKWDEAETMLRQALVLAPNNIVARSWLTLVLFQTGREEEAIEMLQRHPIADEPYLQARLVLNLERIAMQRGERKGVFVPMVPTWLRLPVLSWLVGYALRWRGERLLEDGNWDKAAWYLSSAVQLRPKDIWARLLLTVALLEGGYWTQAEQALTHVPESVAERKLVSAALLVRRREMREAIKVLRACEERHPMTRYYMAVALGWLGEIERACAAFLEPLYRDDPAALRQRIRELARWLSG